jgi:hypothetical protein
MQIIRTSFSHKRLSNNKSHSAEASSPRFCAEIHGFEGWQDDKPLRTEDMCIILGLSVLKMASFIGVVRRAFNKASLNATGIREKQHPREWSIPSQ